MLSYLAEQVTISQGSTREAEPGRRHALRDLVQRIGQCDCGGWVGKSETRQHATRRGRLGPGCRRKLLSTCEVSPSSGENQPCS